ncbi:MAG: hypothetical protein HY900_02765, partial [Deltaproteobacteria bacterium]|nr:hypothetical protein [Deltaproteobacteria bacterium]
LDATATAGLCAICHGGAATGTWTAAQLDAIDWSTGEGLWVSTGDNGHKNVVLGGSGSTNALNNIFTRTRRGSATRAAVPTGNRTATTYLEDAGLGTTTSGSSEGGYSYRGQDGYNLAPSLNRPYAWRYYPWGDNYNTTAPSAGSAIAAGTPNLEVGGMAAGSTAQQTEAASYNAQSKYHTFNCGKCHNPHASRLPKLLITNCLDTNHNTWDDTLGKTLATVAAPFASVRSSQFSTAQNCHRLDDRGGLSSGSSVLRGTGWNRVTPWVETATPDP